MTRRSFGPVAIITVFLFFAAPAWAQETPACEVSMDATYGVTPENPVRIGGGATTVSARERRYLDALRGPTGQMIGYKRTGSRQGPEGTILDHYVITWPGLETPLEVYLDAYRWDPPKAPQGFMCAAPIGLQRPPADPFDMGRWGDGGG